MKRTRDSTLSHPPETEPVFDPDSDISAGIRAAGLMMLLFQVCYGIAVDYAQPVSRLVLACDLAGPLVSAALALFAHSAWFKRRWRGYVLTAVVTIAAAHWIASALNHTLHGYAFILAFTSLTLSTLVPLGTRLQALVNLIILVAFATADWRGGRTSQHEGLMTLRWAFLTSGIALSQINALLVGFYRKSLRRQVDILNDAAEMRERQIAMMGHDIRGPLVVISGYLDLLEDENLTEREKFEMRGRISHAVKAIDALVANLLDLYRLQERKLEAHLLPIDANGLVERVAEEWHQEASKRKLSMEVALGPLPQTLLLDPLHLERILTNLLSNAIRFTERGAVRVVTLVRDGQVALEVSDTGVGIPSHLLPNLFDRFQTHQSRTDSVGLGLYISRALAEAGGGSIAVDSREGLGSRFTVAFPLRQVQPEAALARPKSRAKAA